MGSIHLRLPESLHEGIRKLARKEKVSINQLITLAVAEKLSALSVEEVINARAARADRKKFQRVLTKVADRAPRAGDR